MERVCYYPAMLDIRGRKCVVIGAGAVGERKVKTLLACGGRVTLVALQLSPGLRRLVNQGKLVFKKNRFKKEYLDKADLVVAATDDITLNREISRLCCRRKIWVNIVDNPGLCNFIVPAVVKRGPLLIAVSTSAQFPLLAKRIKQGLEKIFSRKSGQQITRMASRRRDILLKHKKSGIKKIILASLLE